ncbi:unnamed protein product [Caenorhabditis angaria]|uniref:SXP/RAL-2 family protein Ani s 5-like cation-binding domain-containing protein n=1 Tax=Caenorhabditis angaria TaxID=860376 RepID=A0A9P1MSQ5_9PELO|nr:unnamed protein product [Caenorhabditis angaria]
MQQLLLLTVLIGLSICAVIPRPTINETHFKDAIDREIMEALRSIDEAKKNIENSKNTVRHELEKSEIENTTFSIGNEMRWLFDSMMNAVHDVHVPFMTRSIENETVLPTTTTSMPDNSSLVHDFMEKTREEMKKDIDLLREYYDDIRVEFDEWVLKKLENVI